MDEPLIERVYAELAASVWLRARSRTPRSGADSHYSRRACLDHESIATAHEDQKFGMSPQPGTAALAGLDEEELEHWGVEATDSLRSAGSRDLNATDSLISAVFTAILVRRFLRRRASSRRLLPPWSL